MYYRDQKTPVHWIVWFYDLPTDWMDARLVDLTDKNNIHKIV